MQKIPTGKAQKGMVLAKPITRENGVVLMGEGTELNELLIEKLQDLDIKTILVKGRPLDFGEGEITLEQFETELEERFSTVASDKLCIQIKEIVKKDFIRRREEMDI